MPNATLRLNSGRQYPMIGVQEFDFTHVADTGVSVAAVKLPTNATVIGGELIVDTAWNTGTTATASVGDAANPSRYGSNLDLKTTGRKALSPTGFLGDGSDVVVTPALAGTAATAGKARLVVQYIVANRAHEAQTH